MYLIDYHFTGWEQSWMKVAQKVHNRRIGTCIQTTTLSRAERRVGRRSLTIVYNFTTWICTWSTTPSRAERRVGCRSLKKCIILLQRHIWAVALIAPGSLWLLVGVEAENQKMYIKILYNKDLLVHRGRLLTITNFWWIFNATFSFF